jgi:choline dehydrogenase
MAEKIADRIRGRAALARVETPYFVANGAPARGASVRVDATSKKTLVSAV